MGFTETHTREQGTFSQRCGSSISLTHRVAVKHAVKDLRLGATVNVERTTWGMK
jgi:hypothetical protein